MDTFKDKAMSIGFDIGVKICPTGLYELPEDKTSSEALRSLRDCFLFNASICEIKKESP